MTLKELLRWDAELSARLRIAERPGGLRRAAAFFAHSGDSWFCLAALGALWRLGTEFWRWRAAVLVFAIVITAILVLALKFLIRRRRPAGEWGGIYRSTDPHSFPSGHATRAFMLAVMALEIGPSWFGLALAVWAPLVSLARVAMGVHYVSDILAGVGLGVLMGVVLQGVLM